MDGMGRSRRRSERAADWRRRAFGFVALVAVFLQAFVVETHVHASAPPISAALEQTAAGHADQHASAADTHRATCALCQTLASAGAATLPQAAASIANDAATDAAVVALSLAPPSRSFFWQSRAPPSFL